MKSRILIGHDHRLFVGGLELLLAPEFDILYAMHVLTSLPDAVRRLQPDLVVQGLSNAPEVGLDVISRIHEGSPNVPIVVVTMWVDGKLMADAFRRGATAYVPQISPPAELLEGIRAAMKGAAYVPPSLTGAVIGSLASSTLDGPREPTLTARERDIVRLLANGKLMKEVANELRITSRTVAFHKYRVMKRFDVRTSAELVRFALKRGIA